MKVYNESKGRHVLYIQPGNEIKNVSEWLDETGKAIMFSVIFENGMAIVPSNLGKYLIDKGLASRLIMPDSSILIAA